MPLYYYINTLDNTVSTTSPISFCRSNGPISVCIACSIADQHGCKYREEASARECCMYYREDLNSACDNVWAQRGITKPKPEEDDEAEQAITNTEIIPT